MKHLGFALSMIFSTTVFAAKFAPVPTVHSPTAQKLAEVASSIAKDGTTFGDAGAVAVYAFTRNETERDFTTIKQLSFAKAGATADDHQEDFQNQSTAQIVKFALDTLREDQEEINTPAYKAAASGLTAALDAIKADPGLKVYGNQHADEDGSWQILYVVDATAHQILMVKIGYSGT
jgi:hypothetical protein